MKKGEAAIALGLAVLLVAVPAVAPQISYRLMPMP
jgi:hypothetical protein